MFFQELLKVLFYSMLLILKLPKTIKIQIQILLKNNIYKKQAKA